MKCKNCGHLNKSNMYYCVKCGSALDSSSPIRQYKQSATNNPQDTNVFSKTQKFIIALVIIGILIVVLSAVIPPDMEMPKLAAPVNEPQEQPEQINEEIVDKLNTTIKIGSVSANTKEKVIVNAYITDQNGEPVTGGTASINLFDVKYSGQVQKGNVNILLPQLSENNYETTIVYEGNDKYNPSETKVNIEVNKINTHLEAQQTGDDEVTVTLKTGNNETLSNANIIIIKEDQTQIQQQTNDKGQIIIKLDDTGKQELKLSYPGDDTYNPTETTITVGKEKKETKLDTKYNEHDKTLTITLTTKDNTPVTNALLTIINNNQESTAKTDTSGEVQIQLHDGKNNIAIKYDGNGTLKSSETAVNMVMEQEDNSTDNKTSNETINNTKNSTVNDNDNTINESTKENYTESKTDTTFKIENEDNQTIITLLTEDNQKLRGENIKIVLDNGRQLTEKTDSNGSIMLNLTDESVNEIKLIYEGNDEYNAFNKTLRIINN